MAGRIIITGSRSSSRAGSQHTANPPSLSPPPWWWTAPCGCWWWWRGWRSLVPGGGALHTVVSHAVECCGSLSSEISWMSELAPAPVSLSSQPLSWGVSFSQCPVCPLSSSFYSGRISWSWWDPIRETSAQVRSHSNINHQYHRHQSPSPIVSSQFIFPVWEGSNEICADVLLQCYIVVVYLYFRYQSDDWLCK